MFGARSNKSLGDLGETCAEKYLKKLGYRFIEKNWRCKAGEIDLVFVDQSCLVIVEVKSRNWHPNIDNLLFNNVDLKKQRKLRLLAELYKLQKKQFRSNSIRIDIVGVVFEKASQGQIDLKHIKAAVSGSC